MADRAPGGKAGPARDEFAEFAADLADFVATEPKTSEERLKAPPLVPRVTPSGVKRAARPIAPAVIAPPAVPVRAPAPTRKLSPLPEAAAPVKPTPPPSAVLRALDVARPRAVIPREEPAAAAAMPVAAPRLQLAVLADEVPTEETAPVELVGKVKLPASPPVPRISARALLEEGPRRGSAWLVVMVILAVGAAGAWARFTPRGREVVGRWIAAAGSARAAWVASLHRTEPPPAAAIAQPHETAPPAASPAPPPTAAAETQEAAPTPKPPLDLRAPPKPARPRAVTRPDPGSNAASDPNPY